MHTYSKRDRHGQQLVAPKQTIIRSIPTAKTKFLRGSKDKGSINNLRHITEYQKKLGSQNLFRWEQMTPRFRTIGKFPLMG